MAGGLGSLGRTEGWCEGSTLFRAGALPWPVAPCPREALHSFPGVGTPLSQPVALSGLRGLRRRGTVGTVNFKALLLPSFTCPLGPCLTAWLKAFSGLLGQGDGEVGGTCAGRKGEECGSRLCDLQKAFELPRVQNRGAG